MFAQVPVMRLFRNHEILTKICGNNLQVLKAAPPLVVSNSQMDEFLAAIVEVIDHMHTSDSFWKDALGLARRAVDI